MADKELSTELHLIYLSGVDYAANGYQNATIRGVRRIREVLNSDNSFSGAHDAVTHFLANPTTKMLIDVTSDPELAQSAIEEGVEYAAGAALFEIDPDDLSLPHPDSDPDSDEVTEGDEEVDPEGPFSEEAYKTAMALLGQSDGNATYAFYRAAQLGRTTGDMALYKEVMYAIMLVFPPMPSTGVTVID